MIKTTTKYICDVCNQDMRASETIMMPVWFHTEQDEGRAVEPYISKQKIDICTECMKKCLKLNGSGAQGINRYWIEKEATKDEYKNLRNMR